MVNGTAVHISPICIECVISHVESQNAAGPHPLGSFCGWAAGTQIRKPDMLNQLR
jgi:hypothetical protein